MFRLAIASVVVLLPALAAAQVPPLCNSTGPTAPLRFHLPRAEHHEGVSSKTFCETVIVVTHLSSKTALVQVQWIGSSAGPQRHQDEIAPGGNLGFGTNPTLPFFPLFFPGSWGGADILGKANVHSSRKGIPVAAKLVCRAGPNLAMDGLVAIEALPAIDLR